jgi:LacI family transcriptional regulator
MEDETRLTLQDPAHAALLSGLVERAHHRHYTVTVLVSSPADIDRYVSSMLRQQRIAGLFLSLQGVEGAHSALLQHLGEFGVPTVVLEQRTDPPVRAVTSDNEGGGAKLARHLLELGHRRVGYLTGAVEWPGGERRFAGFSAVMRDAGAEVPIWRSPGWNPHAAQATATPVLASADRPTAIFAANDQLAIGVLQAAESLGLDVPGDLSVAGFDDFDLAGLVRPALTTVRIDFVAMGEWAAETLVTLAEGGDPAPVVTLPTSLVVRASTGPAPAP